jgi:hypothetical protein
MKYPKDADPVVPNNIAVVQQYKVCRPTVYQVGERGTLGGSQAPAWARHISYKAGLIKTQER